MMAGKPDVELHHRTVKEGRTKPDADGKVTKFIANTRAAVYRMDLNPRRSQQRAVPQEDAGWHNAVRLIEDQ
jgi:hypothetical protein